MSKFNMPKIFTILSFSFITTCLYAQSNLNGTWTGMGYQFDLNETWSIILNIDKCRYYIEYPSLHCSGELQFLKQEDNKIFFREKLITGDCVSNGILVLEKTNENKLIYRWSYPDGKPGSTAELIKFY